MVDENNFKLTLSKALERAYLKDKLWFAEDFIDVYTTLPSCGLYFEYTGIFTRTEWNTFRAVMHIQVPLAKINIFEKYQKEILEEASKLFGKQDDYYLVELNIELLIEKYEVLDFSVLGLNETLKLALGDATTLMAQGKYSSSVDRVHTALHGYLRVRLDELNVSYEESDMMPKLFNLLYKKLEQADNDEINGMMLKSLRGASAILDVLNDVRNRYSLAHPNDEIITEYEANFVLGLTKCICDYMDKRKFIS